MQTSEPYENPPIHPGNAGPSQGSGTNGLAVAGLVLGILSIVPGWCLSCFAPVIAIPGLILSFVALSQLKTSGQEGRGLAIAGAITSGITMVLSVALIIVYAIVIALGGEDGSEIEDLIPDSPIIEQPQWEDSEPTEEAPDEIPPWPPAEGDTNSAPPPATPDDAPPPVNI